MGPKTVVTRDQARSGAELLRRLPAGGVIVTAAAWAVAEGDAQPYLYVVSPTREAVGPLDANGRMGAVLDELNRERPDPFDRIGPFEVKLLGPSDRLARGLVDYARHVSEVDPWHTGRLGDVYVDAAYIYPATMFAPAAPTSPAGS